jgi:anaerobic dimethyl sulfoxide reductase subunit B (iron-sulfur subunit)
MTYAFTFDASACSGCKACQIACKDKNNLPVGVLWRRVVEISGGSWEKQNDAWITDVFAYNLSIACNHCVHPKCAGVCPTDAYVVREDGIVYIDESKCVGCGYCSWACPYSAPMYNPEAGHMTKCNFCYDNIDAGLSPACVAACPMRVLEFATVDDERQTADDERWTMDHGLSSIVHRSKSLPLWNVPGDEHPFPLPTFSRTQPHLAIKPHVAMMNSLEKVISNWDEIKPQRTPRMLRKINKNLAFFAPFEVNLDELPLIVFTLLAQMAAGMAVFSLFFPLSTFYLLSIGFLLGIAGVASILHLGKPMNAWRTLNHLEKSWLSREILMFGLFGVSWLASLVMPGMGKLPLALSGIGLVYSMAQVYRFKAAPAWNTWRTPAAFFLSALVLGRGLTAAFVAGDVLNHAAGQTTSFAWMGLSLAVLLGLELGIMLTAGEKVYSTVNRLRGVLIGLGILGAAIVPVVPLNAGAWSIFPIFLLVLIEETIGRWLFYEARNPVL